MAGHAAAVAASRPNRRARVSTSRQTQRERILGAIVGLTARDGYEATTIGQIIAHAGVSRPTFYEYFVDKNACFVEALATIHRQLLLQIEMAVKRATPERAAYVTIEAIADFCNSQPRMARVLITASLAGSSQALNTRDKHIAAVAHVLDSSHHSAPVDSPIPDIASEVLIGGIYRLLGSRMRQDKLLDAATLADIIAWAQSYAAPSANRRWDRLRLRPIATLRVTVETPFGSAPLATRSHSREEELEHQRQRMLFAAASLAEEQGFNASTIADINRRAGVGYRKFRHLFTSKLDIFLALHDLGYRRTLAATAGAYFSHGTWPERTWAAGQAYTEFVGKNPTLAHIGITETYAVGPRAEKQMDDVLKVFTLFLYDGYAYLADGRPRPSRVALDTIAATIFDLAYQQCRLGECTKLPTLLPRAIFLALTPFLGPDDANRFIESKLDVSRINAA